MTKAGLKIQNSFRSLETIEEDDQATEIKPMQDQSWPKIDNCKPSATKQQPAKVAPSMPRVSNRREWKPLELEEIPEVRFIAPVEKQKSTSLCQMTFHVTDAKKILASVNRMVEAGNTVVFAQPGKPGGSYVQSPSGTKAYMQKRRGIYVMDVAFLDGKTAVAGEVVVDSGAADNVMPNKILNSVELLEPEPRAIFVAADGNPIGNYGRKNLQFIPLAFWESEFGTPFQGRA